MQRRNNHVPAICLKYVGRNSVRVFDDGLADKWSVSFSPNYRETRHVPSLTPFRPVPTHMQETVSIALMKEHVSKNFDVAFSLTKKEN